MIIFDLAFDDLSVNKDDNLNQTRAVPYLLMKKKTVKLFQYFSYFTYYFFSLMQSIDIYKMVCDPFSYSEYSELKNIVRQLVIGCSICFLLACDNFTYIAAAAIVLKDPSKYLLDWSPEMNFYFRISRCTEIFHAVKILTMKLLYSGLVIFLSHKTRLGLLESENMANVRNQAKVSAQRRIFLFALVPLGINFFYLIPELLIEIFPNPQLISMDSGTTPPVHVRSCISACMVTIGSFSYFIAYPIVFPAVRRYLCCCWRNEEEEPALTATN